MIGTISGTLLIQSLRTGTVLIDMITNEYIWKICWSRALFKTRYKVADPHSWYIRSRIQNFLKVWILGLKTSHLTKEFKKHLFVTFLTVHNCLKVSVLMKNMQQNEKMCRLKMFSMIVYCNCTPWNPAPYRYIRWIRIRIPHYGLKRTILKLSQNPIGYTTVLLEPLREFTTHNTSRSTQTQLWTAFGKNRTISVVLIPIQCIKPNLAANPRLDSDSDWR